MPVGTTRQAFVDADDVAAVAAIALTEEGHSGQTYEVTGPDAISFAEAAQRISDASGRPVSFDGSPEGFTRVMTHLGTAADETAAAVEVFARLQDAGARYGHLDGARRRRPSAGAV